MRRFVRLWLLCCLFGTLANAAPPALEPVTVQLKCNRSASLRGIMPCWNTALVRWLVGRSRFSPIPASPENTL